MAEKCNELCKMTKKITVPQIRFKEFSDLPAGKAGEWEEKKLIDFVNFYAGLTYTPNDVQETGTLVLRSSNVSNGEIIDADNVYVHPKVVNSENVQVGDIIVVVRNGSRSLIGKHAQIKCFMPNTVIGAFMTGIRSECPDFTNALLDTPHFDEEVSLNMGATINQITGYMFSKMEFYIPSLSEQQKIGSYFRQLDRLITLYQRKYNKLTSVKKSMLQKMFPASGQTVPALRFAGFTDKWEVRKLGEVCSITTGYPFDSNDFCDDGDYLVITNSNVQDNSPNVVDTVGNHIFVKNISVMKTYILDEADILVTMDGTVGRTAKVISNHQILAQRVGRLKARYDSEFLYQWLNTGTFSKSMLELAHGGTIKHISLNEIGSYESAFPKSLSEQQKIGSYFRQLDHLIALHQQELQKLQNLKKACLKKMFV